MATYIPGVISGLSVTLPERVVLLDMRPIFKRLYDLLCIEVHDRDAYGKGRDILVATVCNGIDKRYIAALICRIGLDRECSGEPFADIKAQCMAYPIASVDLYCLQP